MFAKYISLLPEVLLLCNVIAMFFARVFRNSQTPKTFATISKFFIGLSLISCVIFYNRSIDGSWYNNTPYTSFFKSLILFSALISNFLSCKWFLSQNYSSFTYYSVISMILLGYSISISSQNMLLLYFSLLLVTGLPLAILGINLDTEKRIIIRNQYGINFIICSVILSLGTYIIYRQTGSFSYDIISQHYQSKKLEITDYLGASLLIVSILYILGAAPFHLMSYIISSQTALPVFSILQIFSSLAGLGILITFYHSILVGAEFYIHNILLLCGVLSIVIGVIGANIPDNIRRIFSCVSLFSIGIILLMLSHFNSAGLQGGIIYFLIYLLSIFGVYTCFYGMKRHGEYLQNLEDLSGLSSAKPYISASILIFIVTFLGIPPLVGVLGNIILVNTLLEQHNIGLILFIFIMLIWLAHGLLAIIKSLYFDKRTYNFDRADKGVYFCLIINILIILFVVTKPRYLMYDIEQMINNYLM